MHKPAGTTDFMIKKNCWVFFSRTQWSEVDDDIDYITSIWLFRWLDSSWLDCNKNNIFFFSSSLAISRSKISWLLFCPLWFNSKLFLFISKLFHTKYTYLPRLVVPFHCRHWSESRTLSAKPKMPQARLASCIPMPLEPKALVSVIEKAKDWALMHGVGMRDRKNFTKDAIQVSEFPW